MSVQEKQQTTKVLKDLQWDGDNISVVLNKVSKN